MLQCGENWLLTFEGRTQNEESVVTDRYLGKKLEK
jgi:hypothetical protein